MIKMKVVNLTAQNRQRMVWLQSHDDEMMLPIIIGDAEAIAISFELAGKQMSRPLTHDLLKSILEQFDAQVERVDIVDLQEDFCPPVCAPPSLLASLYYYTICRNDNFKLV